MSQSKDLNDFSKDARKWLVEFYEKGKVENLNGDVELIEMVKHLQGVISVLLSMNEFNENSFLDKRGFSKKEKNEFRRQFNIIPDDKKIISEILNGTALKNFNKPCGLNQSRANNVIREIREKLDLKNREQLVFVFGWMRLIDPDYSCLRKQEK